MFWLLKYKVILDESRMSFSFVSIFVFPVFSSRKEKLKLIPFYVHLYTIFFIKMMREDQMRKN